MIKYISLILVSVFLFSCSSDVDKNPLVVPPNFAEMPDPNNPEKPTKKQQEANVARLKELLLKSDEEY